MQRLTITPEKGKAFFDFVRLTEKKYLQVSIFYRIFATGSINPVQNEVY
jgi:hypothetical protein